MKVLLIGNQVNTILLFRRRLIEILVGKKFDVYTLTMDGDAQSFNEIKKIGANPQKYTFSRSGMNPVSDFVNAYKLSRKIKAIKPDIVFCFFPKPVIFGALASKIAGVKNVNLLLEGLGYCFTAHERKDSYKKRIVRTIQVLLYRLSLPLAKKVMFLNNDDYNDLIVKNKIEVKSSEIVGGIGVDLTEYAYSPSINEVIHFTMVSRLLIDKGVREFVEAAQIVKNKYPDVRFSIAGSFDDNPGGISRDEYAVWLETGSVEFMGQISNVKDYLVSGSVFVLPSYREGVPRSTQEAMAIGRPVITTDVPGCRETIVDGYNGFIIPPWDALSLANKMITFIENPHLIEKMGLASREIAEKKFNQDEICNRLIESFIAK